MMHPFDRFHIVMVFQGQTGGNISFWSDVGCGGQICWSKLSGYPHYQILLANGAEDKTLRTQGNPLEVWQAK
jgi:hypothetical protein